MPHCSIGWATKLQMSLTNLKRKWTWTTKLFIIVHFSLVFLIFKWRLNCSCFLPYWTSFEWVGMFLDCSLYFGEYKNKWWPVMEKTTKNVFTGTLLMSRSIATKMKMTVFALFSSISLFHIQFILSYWFHPRVYMNRVNEGLAEAAWAPKPSY